MFMELLQQNPIEKSDGIAISYIVSQYYAHYIPECNRMRKSEKYFTFPFRWRET
jgi:hypothetical protein